MDRRAAEFFAGIGLVRMGLERAGWKVSFANDIAPEKFSMYKDNFNAQDFFLGDIRNVKADMVPNVTLATVSFPCIDLSLAGNRGGLNGHHSSSYWEFYRIIKQMHDRRPSAIILENVVGLLSSDGGQDLRSILLSLGKLGYSYDVVIVDAVHFVPQSRPRLFVIANLWPHTAKALNLPIHEARPRQVIEFIHKNHDLRWGHVTLPPLPTRKHELNDLVECFGNTSSVWWDKERQSHLFTQMSPSHKLRLRELLKSKRNTFATVYKRVRPAGCRAELRTDGIAGCLRTPRGGSSKQFVIQAGQGEWRVRNMTAREYARLQGVPDSFKINLSFNKALLGFGDAVCVPVVEWIVKYCVNPMLPD